MKVSGKININTYMSINYYRRDDLDKMLAIYKQNRLFFGHARAFRS